MERPATNATSQEVGTLQYEKSTCELDLYSECQGEDLCPGRFSVELVMFHWPTPCGFSDQSKGFVFDVTHWTPAQLDLLKESLRAIDAGQL